MKLQLLKLIIWPRSNQFPPRTVEFKPGMLNVITGASRTGKSAIIPIIDYCFAASDCYIPIDTIRDYSSWYGIVFQTEQEQVLLARRVPVGNHVSNDFYFQRSELISLPIEIKDKNESTDGIKNYLNTISGVPYFSLEGDEEKRGYTARLGFRDLMSMLFQTQDIVANQNILFYQTHAHEHRERLRNWFPFILGAENIDTLKARQRIQLIEKRLAQLRREYDRTKSVSSAWKANMEGHLRIAKEYGLLKEEVIDDTDPELLLGIAKSILQFIPEHSLTEFKDISTANENISDLEIEERTIEGLLDNKKDFQRRFDLIMQTNKEARDEFQRRKNMFLFLGHMRASMETFESLVDGGELQLEISHESGRGSCGKNAGTASWSF